MHDDDPFARPAPKQQPDHPFLTVAAAWLVVFTAVLAALWMWSW